MHIRPHTGGIDDCVLANDHIVSDLQRIESTSGGRRVICKSQFLNPQYHCYIIATFRNQYSYHILGTNMHAPPPHEH